MALSLREIMSAELAEKNARDAEKSAREAEERASLQAALELQAELDAIDAATAAAERASAEETAAALAGGSQSPVAIAGAVAGSGGVSPTPSIPSLSDDLPATVDGVPSSTPAPPVPPIDDDLAFAMMLQAEEDAAAQLRAQELDERQGSAKIRVAHYKPLRATTTETRSQAPVRYSAADAELMSAADLDGFDEVDEGDGEIALSGPSLPPGPGGNVPIGAKERRRRGKRSDDGSIVTKHDPTVCGRRNAQALEQNFSEAVGSLGHQQLPNTAFNSIRSFLSRQTAKGQSTHGKVAAEERATREGVMDRKTRLTLFRLQSSGRLGTIGGVVATGKEASVYHGDGWTDEDFPTLIPDSDSSGKHNLSDSGDVAIKIFRMTLNEFSNRAAYMKGDHRFHRTNIKKQTTQKLVPLWAEKEMRNLVRVYRAGIPCPKPLLLEGHVIVMTFIGGSDGWAAPQLRAAASGLSPSLALSAYLQVVNMMGNLWHRSKLVHGDLSEYNILYHRKRCYMIDVGQAVEHTAPQALTLLNTDATNITNFFRRLGVDTLPVDDLVALITASESEVGEDDFLFSLPSRQPSADGYKSDGEAGIRSAGGVEESKTCVGSVGIYEAEAGAGAGGETETEVDDVETEGFVVVPVSLAAAPDGELCLDDTSTNRAPPPTSPTSVSSPTPTPAASYTTEFLTSSLRGVVPGHTIGAVLEALRTM